MSTDRTAAGGRGRRTDRAPQGTPAKPGTAPGAPSAAPAGDAGAAGDDAAVPPRPPGRPGKPARPAKPAEPAPVDTRKAAPARGAATATMTPDRPAAAGRASGPAGAESAAAAPSSAGDAADLAEDEDLGDDAAHGAGAAARAVPVSRTRRARLKAARVDPWSVMKVSFMLSVALGVVTLVAVTVLWLTLNGMGVFTSIGNTLKEVTESETSSGVDLKEVLSLKNTLLFGGVIAIIDVILVTALATLGAFLYNLTASFTGGVEVTLAEED